jgi:hypothetical protein
MKIVVVTVYLILCASSFTLYDGALHTLPGLQPGGLEFLSLPTGTQYLVDNGVATDTTSSSSIHGGSISKYYMTLFRMD